MPLIKLSALVSDMKGKLNGSVFAGGPNGTYFRNNPSGGGRKSARWDKQKSRLAQLSTMWKGLTPEQQASWNAAVVNYPAVNKFGDPRVRSGYELFMFLNGNLAAANLNLLSTPLVPRELPAISSVTFAAPDYYCIVPSRVPSMPIGEHGLSIMTNDEMIVGANMSNFSSYFSYYKRSNRLRPEFYVDRMLPLMIIQPTDQLPVGVFIVHTATAGSYIYVRQTWIDPEDLQLTVQHAYEIPAELITQEFDVLCQIRIDEVLESVVHYNGVLLTSPATSHGTGADAFYSYPFLSSSPVVTAIPDFSDINAAFTLGDPTFTIENGYIPSNFRYFASDLDADLATTDGDGYEPADWAFSALAVGYEVLLPSAAYQADYDQPVGSLVAQLLHRGYYLETETCVTVFQTDIDARFPNEVDPELSDFYAIGEPAPDTPLWYLIQSWENIVNPYGNEDPYPSFPSGIEALENWFVSIEGCSGVSGLSTISRGRYRQLGIVALDGDAANLSRSYGELFGLPSFNSYYTFRCYLLDATTGVKTKVALETVFTPLGLLSPAEGSDSNARKFKAGSELSGRVN